MANCLPFNAVYDGENYDRVYKAEDWAWYFATFIANGIFPKPSDGLQVIAYSGMEIKVNAGFAFINGYAFKNPASHSIRLDMAEGALNRVDRVVVRWDLPQRDIYIAVLKGTPSAKPQPTAVTRSTEIWELALADIYVGKGVTKIQTKDITDQRFNSSVCGIVTGTVELDAADLERKIESLEKQRYIQCAVVETAPEKKAVTIYYCAEAAEGMVFDADGVTGTVTAVTHIQSEKAREMEENGNDRTVLTLSKGVEAAGGVIALETAAMVAGMTADDIKALKGVLKQYE